MKVRLLSCWFTTSYGTYTDGLRKALERNLGGEVGVIASNCGCGDPMEVNRKFIDGRCEFVEFPNVPYHKMSTSAKQLVLDIARQVAYRERARRYASYDGDADVLHFQQILNAFGSLTVFKWLARPSAAARVVTVHELDLYQQAHPATCRSYNDADAVLVHQVSLRDKLVELGVDAARIELVRHGVDLRPLPDEPRAGLVFWGGHKLNASKGLVTLFAALAMLRERMGARAPQLTIHGHYGSNVTEEARQSAEETGVADRVTWLNEIPYEDAVALYRRSLVLAVPFTGSYAGYPAALALASGVPIVGTREAGLPETAGDAAVWIGKDDPVGLAAALQRLLEDDRERGRLAALGRARAEAELAWDVVAARTLAIYAKALAAKTSRGRPAA